MRFDLTDLRLFVHCVEAGTITGGAERTHMTLASASQRVRGMEDALGTPLLVRHKTGVRATEAGRTLLHHARGVLARMAHLREELEPYGRAHQARVRLLCNTSAMTEHLPELLGSFLAQHPRVSIDVEEQGSTDIVEALRDGRCDIGIVSDAASCDGLDHFVFRPDPLMLVVPRGHRLARRRRVALVDAVDAKHAPQAGFSEFNGFVGLAATSPLQLLVAREAKAAGKRLAYRVRMGTFEAVCRMVAQGIGVAVVPAAAALRHAASMKIAAISLTDPWARRNLLACVLKQDELPLNAARMLRHLLAADTQPLSAGRTVPASRVRPSAST